MNSKIIELFVRKYSLVEICNKLGVDYEYVDHVVCEYLSKSLSEISGD